MWLASAYRSVASSSLAGEDVCGEPDAVANGVSGASDEVAGGVSAAPDVVV